MQYLGIHLPAQWPSQLHEPEPPPPDPPLQALLASALLYVCSVWHWPLLQVGLTAKKKVSTTEFLELALPKVLQSTSKPAGGLRTMLWSASGVSAFSHSICGWPSLLLLPVQMSMCQVREEVQSSALVKSVSPFLKRKTEKRTALGTIVLMNEVLLQVRCVDDFAVIEFSLCRSESKRVVVAAGSSSCILSTADFGARVRSSRPRRVVVRGTVERDFRGLSGARLSQRVLDSSKSEDRRADERLGQHGSEVIAVSVALLSSLFAVGNERAEQRLFIPF